jgi:hypothetical protein
MRGANSLESLDSVSSSIQQARANSLNQVSLPKIISDKNVIGHILHSCLIFEKNPGKLTIFAIYYYVL